MKNSIKKILAIAMAIGIVSTMCVSAFAAPAVLTNENKTGDATVYYKEGKITDPQDPDDPIDDVVEGTYTVIVPEYIQAAAMNKTPVTEKVTAKDVMLLPSETLSVACEYSGDLLLREDGTTTLAYKMQNNDADFASGDVVLAVAAGTPYDTFDTNVGSILTEAPIYAGVYTDTVTFSCSVA